VQGSWEALKASTVTALSGVVLMLALLAPTSAVAATQLGETFAPPTACDPNAANLQSSSPAGQYTVGFQGVITSWSFQTGPAALVKLKVGRPVGGNSFQIVGESSLTAVAAGSSSSFPTRISVEPGDVIGNWTNTSNCGRGAAASYVLRTNYPAPDPPVGTTSTYSQVTGFQVDISATLEPDCDGDGFGDESQDQDLNACPPGPTATITAGPKDKTSKKNATFVFTANEPVATFECALDGGPFGACSSPDTLKVKKGKHHFEVRAADAGGNVGGAASDDWKVKRKK
jgi:hypothetical protein